MAPGQQQDPLLLDQPGHRELLLGNEAIVRGALEAGVGYACGYPGTPSSEVTDSFARVAPAAGIPFEYSVNEKVALEMAFAASLAGARSICAMKHLGLMAAGDPLSTIPYVGPSAGLVIVSAGDPSCRTSPNEQDQRYLAPMLHIPLLDPSTVAEAQQMARFAFELSERSRLPVILRITTRICHSRGVIEYGALAPRPEVGFVRDPARLVPIPINARRLRVELNQRMETARQLISDSTFVRGQGDAPLAILATGSPAATCQDLLASQGLEQRARLITVGGVHPLPDERLLQLLAGVQRLLVVEELSPYLEDAVLALLARSGVEGVQVLGKRSGHLPEQFEYEPAVVQQGIHQALGLGPAPAATSDPPPAVPPRPPILCAGCSHRATYFAARAAFGDEHFYFNDIGCYTLGYGPPLNAADALLCMGASVTLAAGVSKVIGQRTVGFIGDSTFFHSGMPPLLNAVKEGAQLVLVIMDNSVTAMTGFQESPFVDAPDGQPTRRVSIEGVVRALGVEQVVRVDPYDLPATVQAMERARDASGVSVVISERPCGNFVTRSGGNAVAEPYVVDHQRCQSCGREPCGGRCAQQPTWGYQHHATHTRSVHEPARAGDPACEPRPAVAPCSAQCPISICVQGYVGHVAAGEYAEALAMILERNPLPDTVCRVCHHPCEAVCLRGELDQPVAINHLKRFVLDWAASQPEQLYDPPREADHGRKAAVVGAGPAGLTAAHELRLRGYSVTLLDADEQPGGLLLSGIPAYRLPRAALQRDVDRIIGLGVEFRGGVALGRDVTLGQLLEQQRFDAVFVAVGAHHSPQLGLPGEGEPGPPQVQDALSYLRAACLGDAPQQARRVVVVGGGNAAMDAARAALRQGAQQVVVAYRRRRTEMPAIESEVAAAAAEGVELLTQVQPLSIFRGKQAGLEVVRTEPGEPDASGRCKPMPVGGSEQVLQADLIIAAVGQLPHGDLLAEGDLPLARHSDGSFKVDAETAATSDPRVFAGGDLVWGERTVTAAMAWGQRAAWGIDRQLRGAAQADRRQPPPRPQTLTVEPGPWLARADRGAPRQQPPERVASDRRGDFSEASGALSEQQARAEAARCMACGLCGNCRACIDLFGCPAFFLTDLEQPQIEPSLCIGCGVCAAFCPNGAIRRVE